MSKLNIGTFLFGIGAAVLLALALVSYVGYSESLLGMMKNTPYSLYQQKNQSSIIKETILKSTLNKKKENPFIIGSDAQSLKDIWGLSYNTSKFECPNLENSKDYSKFPVNIQKIDINGISTIEGGEYKATIDYVDGIKIVTFFPKELDLASAPIKTGKSLISAWVKWMQKNIGTHPCGTQYIIAYKKYTGIASAWLGFIQVGGGTDTSSGGGYNSYLLMWHELSHTYYFLTDSSWLVEGIPNIMRYLILDDKKNSVDWSGGAFNGDNTFTIDNIIWQTKCTGNCPEETELYKNSLCKLPPSIDYDSISKHGRWGEMFFADISDRYGKSQLISILRLLYKKSMYSGENITKQDFYKAFTYFIGKNDLKADAFVKEKLCL